MKEFRFSRLVIALVVLMKYMTKISDAGKNPAYTSRNFPIYKNSRNCIQNFYRKKICSVFSITQDEALCKSFLFFGKIFLTKQTEKRLPPASAFPYFLRFLNFLPQHESQR